MQVLCTPVTEDSDGCPELQRYRVLPAPCDPPPRAILDQDCACPDRAFKASPIQRTRRSALIFAFAFPLGPIMRRPPTSISPSQSPFQMDLLSARHGAGFRYKPLEAKRADRFLDKFWMPWRWIWARLSEIMNRSAFNSCVSQLVWILRPATSWNGERGSPSPSQRAAGPLEPRRVPDGPHSERVRDGRVQTRLPDRRIQFL